MENQKFSIDDMRIVSEETQQEIAHELAKKIYPTLAGYSISEVEKALDIVVHTIRTYQIVGKAR